MSQTNGSSEPSMEEILASIRNIIAQDPVRAPGATSEPEKQGATKSTARDPSTAAASTGAAKPLAANAAERAASAGDFPDASAPFPTLSRASASPAGAADPVLPLASRSPGAGDVSDGRTEPRLSRPSVPPPAEKAAAGQADDFSDVFEDPLPKLSISPTPFAPKPADVTATQNAKPAIPPPPAPAPAPRGIEAAEPREAAGAPVGKPASDRGVAGIPPPPGAPRHNSSPAGDKSLSDALAAVIGSRPDQSAAGKAPAQPGQPASDATLPSAVKPVDPRAEDHRAGDHAKPAGALQPKPFDFAALRARATQAIAPDQPDKAPVTSGGMRQAVPETDATVAEPPADEPPKGPTLIAAMSPRKPAPRPDADAEAGEVLIDPSEWQSLAAGETAGRAGDAEAHSNVNAGESGAEPPLASANVGFLAAKPRPFDTADGSTGEPAAAIHPDDEPTEIIAEQSPAANDREEVRTDEAADAAAATRAAVAGAPAAAAPAAAALAAASAEAQPAPRELRAAQGASRQDLGTSLSTQGLSVSNIVVSSEGGRVKTLEDTVAELLRPLLREWLENNMPRIVENALRLEVADSVKKQFEATTRKPNGHGN